MENEISEKDTGWFEQTLRGRGKFTAIAVLGALSLAVISCKAHDHPSVRLFHHEVGGAVPICYLNENGKAGIKRIIVKGTTSTSTDPTSPTWLEITEEGVSTSATYPGTTIIGGTGQIGNNEINGYVGMSTLLATLRGETTAYRDLATRVLEAVYMLRGYCTSAQIKQTLWVEAIIDAAKIGGITINDPIRVDFIPGNGKAETTAVTTGMGTYLSGTTDGGQSTTPDAGTPPMVTPPAPKATIPAAEGPDGGSVETLPDLSEQNPPAPPSPSTERKGGEVGEAVSTSGSGGGQLSVTVKPDVALPSLSSLSDDGSDRPPQPWDTAPEPIKQFFDQHSDFYTRYPVSSAVLLNEGDLTIRTVSLTPKEAGEAAAAIANLGNAEAALGSCASDNNTTAYTITISTPFTILEGRGLSCGEVKRRIQMAFTKFLGIFGLPKSQEEYIAIIDAANRNKAVGKLRPLP